MLDYADFISQQRLPNSYIDFAQKWFKPALERTLIAHNSKKPLIIGLNGAQGSGKSTLAAWLAYTLSHEHQLSVCAVSIDDFYYSQQTRIRLANTIHPLLRTRGVPGTHDIKFAIECFARLRRKESAIIPRFNKAEDNLYPKEEWTPVSSSVDVIIFEGWCVGIPPQSFEALVTTLNPLEGLEDKDLTWRCFVNNQLTLYQEWFACIDSLWALIAPDFDCVYQWRLEQETKLKESYQGTGTRLMGEQQIKRFIQHYQRLTEHAISTLPNIADSVFLLDKQRNILRAQHKPE